MRPEPQATFADAALWALWVSMRQRVPIIAAAIGLGPIECAGGPAAIQAQTRLAAAGVQVDTLGAVSFTRNAIVEYEAGPWVHDTPTLELGSLRIEARPDYDTIANDSRISRLPRRFARIIFKHLESLAATRLWAGLADQRDRQAGLLSAGGAGNGGVWQNLPKREEDFFPSGHFKVASLRRLGGLRAPPGATCAGRRAQRNQSAAGKSWTPAWCTQPCASREWRAKGRTACSRPPWRDAYAKWEQR